MGQASAGRSDPAARAPPAAQEGRELLPAHGTWGALRPGAIWVDRKLLSGALAAENNIFKTKGS